MRFSIRWTLVPLLLLSACAGEPSDDAVADEAPTSGEDEAQATPEESTPTEYRGMMLYYANASTAENAGEFESARRWYEEGLELVSSSPHMLLGLARNAALLGDRKAALDALDRYAEVGAHADLEAIGAFDELREDERFLEISPRIASIDAPAPHLQPFLILQPEDLWNEGIACDLETGDLFAGGVKHGKIVRIRDGRQEDLGNPAEDGLMEVLGLDVDEARRELWACTGRDEGTPGGTHDFGETPRANEIVVYSLESGEITRRYGMVPDDRIHMWNDIVVAPNGTAYFTDMTVAELHRIADGAEPELFLALDDFNYPNGIATSEDGRLLYVACLESILVIDLESGRARPLDHDRSVFTGLGDGMSVIGRDLFLVQNNQLLGYRTLHCRLDATGRRVISAKALRFRSPEGQMPFTCAVDEKRLYVNATTSFDRFDSEEAPKNSVIFALEYQN